MKKIINSALAVTFVTLLFSCQKQDGLIQPVSKSGESQLTPNKLVTLPPVTIPFTLSDWISVPLSLVKDGSLYGRHELSTPLTGGSDTDVKLAYVRRSTPGISTSDDSFSYFQLPAVLVSNGRHPVSLEFELGTDLFEVYFRSTGIVPAILDPQEFKDCRFRYIVISREIYDNLDIDWIDYPAVARALGFTP